MTTHSRSHSASKSKTGAELLTDFEPEMSKLSDDEVLPPNLDVDAAATTAIAAMPRIEAQREALEAFFGKQAKTSLDRVIPTARALIAAIAVHSLATDVDLEPSAQGLRQIRDRLLHAAHALIDRGLVDGKTLGVLIGGSSYQALAMDVIRLYSWFGSHAEAIAERSKVTNDELRNAYQAAEQFKFATAQRDSAQAGTSQSAKDRARIFTLFFHAYDGVRKMLGYLRWHEGDADTIAPSVYVRDRSARRDTQQTSVGTTPAVPHDAPAAGLPGAPPFHT